MSPRDEYKDLKEQLRQQKPQAEALSPAVRHRLRNRLLQQAAEKPARRGFGMLAVAFAVAALVILPLLYWVWQGSFQGSGPLSAGPGPDAPEPALSYALTPEAAETAPGEVDAAADWVEIRSAFPQPGSALSASQDPMWAMVAYQLLVVEASQLQLRLEIATGPEAGRVVSYASTGIDRGQGTKVMSLPLAGQEWPGPDTTLRLVASLLGSDGETDGAYATDLQGRFSWPVASPEDAGGSRQPSAAVLGSGIAEPNEGGRLVPGAQNYQTEITVAYDLGGEYDQGVVTLSYTLETESLGSSGGSTVHVETGRGIVTFPLALEAEFYGDDGALLPEVELWVELMGFDRSANEYISLYPFEASQAPESAQEHLQIQSAQLGQDGSGAPALIVSLWYERKTGLASEILVTLEDGGAAPVASVAQPIHRQRDRVDVVLPADLSAYTGDMLLRLAATMEGEEATLMDELPLLVGALAQERSNELWVVSVTPGRDSLTGRPMQEMLVGYDLAETYTSGRVSHAWQQQSLTTGAGSGGGESPIEPGRGLLRLYLPGSGRSQEPGPTGWPPGLTMSLTLHGHVGEAGQDGLEETLFHLALP